MAKILARSKTGKKFNIAVEDKHKYGNFTQQIIRLNHPDNTKNDDNGYIIGQNVLAKFDLSDYVTITQGTGEDQRIGNKVFMKWLHWTYSISFDADSMLTNLPHGTLFDFFARFRVMVVKFDKAMTEQDIVDWFKATYVYFRVTGSTFVQSTHQTKMRESTVYTGKFKILYDKKIKMGRKKSVKLSNIPIRINQNLNFDPSTNKPTDENFKYIYGLIIGPSYNEIDLDATSYNSSTRFSQSAVDFANTGGMLKYEYYDL